MARYYVGVGGQKCGTGWLSSALKQRPQFLRHTIKEMHVFDCLFSKSNRRYWMPRFERKIAELEAELAACPADGSAERQRRSLSIKLNDRRDHLTILQARRRSRSLQRYEQYFTDRMSTEAARSKVRWFGEITPAYALLPADGFRAILSVYPDAHFIFLMRDPVDRFWSALKMRHHDEPHLDPIATFDDALRTPWIVGRSAYEGTLAVLDEVVPRSQQLVVFYEDLFSPNGTELARMSEFLEIDLLEADRSTYRNKGGPGDLPPALAQRATQALLPTYRSILDRCGRVPDRWQERLAEVG